jgi:2-methylcitrate dehydratase PrpD
MNGVTVPNATQGNANGSVTLLGAPVFAAAGLASVIDPDAAAWINGAAADILDTETTVLKCPDYALQNN